MPTHSQRHERPGAGRRSNSYEPCVGKPASMATSYRPMPLSWSPCPAGRTAVTSPGPLYQRLLAEALEVTEADLGFAAVPRPIPPQPLPAGPDLVAYLDAVLVQHIQADRHIGSCWLIGVVQEQLKTIELCLTDTRSALRPEFPRLGNRYSEFCGCLNQDQGRYSKAEV